MRRIVVASVSVIACAISALVWAVEHHRLVVLYEDPYGTGTVCRHWTSETTFKMSKMNDKLYWDVRNTCLGNQFVILCSYAEDGKWDPAAFDNDKCNSKPPGAKMNSPFEVLFDGSVELKCKAKKTGKMTLYVDADASTLPCPTPTLPPRDPSKHEARDHKIDIEVVP
jgi:hypothetical protein